MLHRIIKITVLCVALIVVGAVTAASAFATAEFTTEVEPAALTGEQSVQNRLSVTNTGGGFTVLQCANALYQGTVAKKAGTSFALTPEWSTCTLGGKNATIKFNGCRLGFSGTAVAKTFNVSLSSCTTLKSVVVTQGNCTIELARIPENQNLPSAVFANAGTGKTEDSTGTLNVTTLKSVQTGSECPDPGLTSNDTKLTGSITVEAFVDKGTKKVTVNEHEFDSVLCGEQVFFKTD